LVLIFKGNNERFKFSDSRFQILAIQSKKKLIAGREVAIKNHEFLDLKLDNIIILLLI
jgi:hypothetical protein